MKCKDIARKSRNVVRKCKNVARKSRNVARKCKNVARKCKNVARKSTLKAWSRALRRVLLLLRHHTTADSWGTVLRGVTCCFTCLLSRSGQWARDGMGALGRVVVVVVVVVVTMVHRQCVVLLRSYP